MENEAVFRENGCFGHQALQGSTHSGVQVACPGARGVGNTEKAEQRTPDGNTVMVTLEHCPHRSQGKHQALAIFPNLLPFLRDFWSFGRLLTKSQPSAEFTRPNAVLADFPPFPWRRSPTHV
jgi:hypothetical protein